MKQKPTKKCENGVQLRPASIEEAGLFYSELDEKQDEALGTVGHIRMDFGSGGKEFWHTWWPHNEDRFNTLEFKEELQAIVDTLRANGPLKDLASMSNYCHKNGGAITEDSRSFGYVAETDHYRYCLRCTPTPGDYQGYLYCYDKRQQEMAQKDKIVGRVPLQMVRLRSSQTQISISKPSKKNFHSAIRPDSSTKRFLKIQRSRKQWMIFCWILRAKKILDEPVTTV